jgi:hypothetical protein
MSEIAEHDADTGEIPELPLSQKAVNGSTPPAYWRHVEAIQGEGGAEYEQAFFAAQGEIEPIIEADAVNPGMRNAKYATLAGLLARVRPVLTKHGLTIKQYPGRIHKLSSDTAKHLFLPICTTLRHVKSGQSETFVWEMPIVKLDAQALGSAATYGRRYSLVGIFGIASVDDDGAAAAIRSSIEKSQGADIIDTLISQINECKAIADLQKWFKMHREGIEAFSDDKLDRLRDAYAARKEALETAEDSAKQLDIEQAIQGAGEAKKGKGK